MRLSDEQRTLIKRLILERVGSDARVQLFGSRTDDTRRGGDIDPLVESPRALPDRFALELRRGARLEHMPGQRVDLLPIDAGQVLQPVHRAAQAIGLPL